MDKHQNQDRKFLSVDGMVCQLLSHETSFRSFLRGRLGNDALAEDLLQQSFVRAVQHQHSVRNDESVVPWFYCVLRNTVIDYYRSQGAESRRNEAFLQELTHLGEDKEPPLDEIQAGSLPMSPSGHPDPAIHVPRSAQTY